jgi:anti-sigma factor RsiW
MFALEVPGLQDHDHQRCIEMFSRLSSYLDGELDGLSCKELARHMEKCEACRIYLQSLEATRNALHHLAEQPEIPAQESERLLKACLESFQANLRTRPSR